MERRHEMAQDMTEQQRHLFFQTSAQIQTIRTHRLGFLVDADHCADIALWALEATRWTSIRSAVGFSKFYR